MFVSQITQCLKRGRLQVGFLLKRAWFSDWLTVTVTTCGAAMVLFSVEGHEIHTEHWFDF